MWRGQAFPCLPHWKQHVSCPLFLNTWRCGRWGRREPRHRNVWSSRAEGTTLPVLPHGSRSGPLWGSPSGGLGASPGCLCCPLWRAGAKALGRRTQILALLQHIWHTHVTMCSHACLLLVRVSLTLCPQPSTQDLVGDMSGIFPSGSPAPTCHRPSLLLQKESSGFLPISAGTVPGLRRTASWARLSLVTASPPHTAATEAGSLLKTTPGTAGAATL